MLIKKIYRAYKIYKTISGISKTQRTSLYRMLYYKTHYAIDIANHGKTRIPTTEFRTLIGNGWLIMKENGYYVWSDESKRIVKLFEEI